MACTPTRLVFSAASRLLVHGGARCRHGIRHGAAAAAVVKQQKTTGAAACGTAAQQRRVFSGSSGLPPGLEDVQRERQSLKDNAVFEAPTEVDMLKPRPPDFIDADTLDALQSSMDLYMKRGVAFQQIQVLAESKSLPLVKKWGKMMEVHLLCQLQVVTPLGYPADHQGLQMFAQHCQQMLNRLMDKDEQLFLHLKHQARSTYRFMISKVFDVNLDDLPELDLAQAREHVHATTSKMVSPEILMQVQKKVARIYHHDPNAEQTMKHQALQDIILNDAFLGKDKVLVGLGYAEGEKGYASYQCVIADYQEDPLIQQYTHAAMMKLYQAAALDKQAQ